MKHVVNIAGFVVVVLVMQLGLSQFGEVELLRQMVGGFEASEMTVDEWLKQFYELSALSIGAGALAFVCWYLYGQFSSPDYGATTTKTPWWIIGLTLPVIAGVAAIFLLPGASSGLWLANAFLVLNGIVMYWLPSIFFSPTNVKTHPILSASLRPMRDKLLP